MAGKQSSSWRLRAGSYLGEISALALLHLSPPHAPSLPLLLAGTGSEIIVYDIGTGILLNSFRVFDGIRVHGIARDGPGSRIAVYGEKRVNLFSVRTCGSSEGERRDAERLVVDFELEFRLPGFDHWVLDALFVEEDSCVVLGLSDNSLVVWDIAKGSVIHRLRSPERCLLYSLRLWGGNLESLKVASGTIYNEIIIWKISQDGDFMQYFCTSDHSGCCNIPLPDRKYMLMHLSTLCGHEGSIFRLAWSHDGSRLISVSDDRSARIWTYSALSKNCERLDNCDASSVVLYGHDARIWDCYISDTIALTVGEDCSCRLWGINGNQLAMIKEHIGRGIWRCLYDPISEVLITAGFDSAIKVHQLQLSSFRCLGPAMQNGVLAHKRERTEIFSISNPYASKQLGKMDSKTEYIRCLLFANEDILYVATNNGYLYHVKLTSPTEWTQVARVSEEAPLICMDLLSNSSVDSVEVEDLIAIGDGKGNVTVFQVLKSAASVSKPKVVFSVVWSAEVERQLLGIYWCRSLGNSHLFTSDPKGTIKVWGLEDALSSQTDCKKLKNEVPLLAVFGSLFRTRIICLDTSFKAQLLVCGDQRGNISLFSFPSITTVLTSNEMLHKIPSITHFKGAHGISSIASVSIGILNSDEVEICTTGGDGCVCYFKFIKASKSLEFIGMKQVKELSMVRSVVGSSSFNINLTQVKFAIGFTSSDFIIWNLRDKIKVLHVSCGGWRRPYSFYFGDLADIQNCFAFLKENIIHIHRLWIPSNERTSLSKLLHMKFHGREIHTLRFIPIGLNDLLIATGCEGGTVRLTRCIQSDKYGWSSSIILGEHASGSAVRSLCFVSRIYTSRASLSHTVPSRHLSQTSSNTIYDQTLLISVGAKQVLTVWLLRKNIVDVEYAFAGTANADNHPNVLKEAPSMAFQWLSSHMPSKHTKKFSGKLVKPLDMSNSSTSCTARKISDLEVDIMPKHENDWRYLAVTAFLIKAADCRSTVCFIVVAGSDATLTLRALLLPCRLWFDVAFLVPQPSPVLSLQHVVSPLYHDLKDEAQKANAYVIVSGSTDGTITFWDLTEPVEHFLQYILKIQPENLVNCLSRPRTGRGSQGGRWWKSARSLSSQNGREDCLDELNAEIVLGNQSEFMNGTSSPLNELGSDITDPKSAYKTTGPSNGMGINASAVDIFEVQPLLVLDYAHQSGVNCLHVSKTKNSHNLESEIYCIVSGGDDQSLHCTIVALKLSISKSISTDEQHTQGGKFGYLTKSACYTHRYHHNMTVLYKSSVTSAHSSAIKGIWTDGEWVFSTGLDQRIRCWHIDACGKPAEHSQVVISVPEPETLDALKVNRNRYRIAVAGRGMQMVVFVDTNKDDTKTGQ